MPKASERRSSETVPVNQSSENQNRRWAMSAGPAQRLQYQFRKILEDLPVEGKKSAFSS